MLGLDPQSFWSLVGIFMTGISATWILRKAIGEIRSDIVEIRGDIGVLSERIDGLDRHLSARIDRLEADVREIKEALPRGQTSTP